MAGFVIALTGAHGTGKTTLARELANRMGIRLFPSRSTFVHRAFGFEPADHIGINARLAVQEAILEQFIIDWQEARKTGGIFDRCPLDFAAYLLADVHRDVDPRVSEAVSQYVRRCITFTDELECVLLCKAHGGKVEDRGSTKVDAAGPAFADHHGYLVAGMLAETRQPIQVIGAGSRTSRVDLALSAINATFNMRAQNAQQGR